MGQRFVLVRLFDNALVSGLASTGIVSSGVDLRNEVTSLTALMFMVSSVASAADVRFEYAVSPDGNAWGSFADFSPLLTSTFSFTGVSNGWCTVSMVPILAPFYRFHVSGTGSNPVDTRCTGQLILRMS